MDLNEILVFSKVVQSGSFSAAARELGLPKSTVSRKVSQLEERLGARLLQRTTRKLSLTDVGAAYYERASRIVADIEEADRTALQMQGEARGTLRVTAPVEFGVAYLGVIFDALLERHPHLHVEVVLTDRVVDLVEEGFDVALRAGRLADSTLIVKKLGAIQRLVVASPDYLARRGRPTSPEDLRDHECILFRAGQEGPVWRLEGPGGVIDVAVSGRFVANNFDLVRDAAIAGHGIALVPASQCCDAIRQGRLEMVLPEWTSPLVQISAVYPSPRHLSPKLKAMLDLLEERFDPPPWAISAPPPTSSTASSSAAARGS